MAGPAAKPAVRSPEICDAKQSQILFVASLKLRLIKLTTRGGLQGAAEER